MTMPAEQQRDQHLTDEQFADSFLGGDVPAAVEVHLATCEVCRLELGSFAHSMDSFSAAAMKWSETQPSFSPRSWKIGPVRFAVSTRGLFASAGWVMAGVLVLAVSIPVISHRETAVAVRNAASLSVQDDSKEQIDQDNDLMQSVNMALQTEDPSPFREYQITDVTGKRSKEHRGVRVQ
jgi:hypothetical protein